MNPILFAIPFFFLLMGLEWFIGYLKHKQFYRLNDTIANLSLGIGSQVVGLFLKAGVLWVYMQIYNHLAPFHIPTAWWSYLLCIIVFDFFFYWAHRWSHEVNFMWGAHAVHHQSEEYNLSVALRQPWFQTLLSFVIFLPMPFMGFAPMVFFVSAGIHTVYQFWIHTKSIGKLPRWVEFWINTPSHHRVHHAVNPQYIDKNHAGMFMIWDRMFGTFKEEETEGEEITYGVTTQFKSWNPTWANVAYYFDMAANARRMTLLKDKLKLIFARPGWLPKELGGFQSPPKVNLATYKKFDSDAASIQLKVYSVFQFIFVLWGTVAFLGNFDHISLFFRFLFLAIIILTIMILGAIYEQKQWVVAAEYVRLALVLVSINSFYFYWYINWFNVMVIFSASAFVVSLAWLTYTYINMRRNVVPVRA